MSAKIVAVYYVYALVDPRTNDPFYIGKGKGDRRFQHVKAWKAGRESSNAAKVAQIGEIFSSGHEVCVEVWHDGLSEQEALDLEEALIAEHRATLTNIVGRGACAPLNVGAATRELARLNAAISELWRPREWARHHLLKYGRLPSEPDWEVYLTIYTAHLAIRDDLQKKLDDQTSKKARTKAA